ncbi:MAG TPA: GGDEF domain-containing protein [Verrucomicrobiae bacterium]|nr:GGDEF domain-containing protein [Verrucomicrobiae bacterium]
MPAKSSYGDADLPTGRLAARLAAKSLSRQAFEFAVKKTPAVQGLEDLLSSALVAGDRELRNIVHEVDEISKALKSGDVPSEDLRVAVHPAVWCALRHVIVERELRYLALTDELTCLYNRRGFFAAATHQLKLAQRNSHDMLLFISDVDNLKGINDSFGHREGDMALVRTADVLEDAFRDSDVLARLGGDEFAVLVTQASFRDQDVILRRLAGVLEKSNAVESRYELSFSVGVARFDPKNPVSLGELMEQADLAMYEQKGKSARPCFNMA